jgi:hypothetical protein
MQNETNTLNNVSLEGHRNRFYSVNQNDTETLEGPGKYAMIMIGRKRFDCLYDAVKS